jgi:putative membrane protein
LFGVPAFEAEIVVTLFVVPSSFLMIFQTNIAYERYWEGRNTISSLVLNSHHLVRKYVVYAKHVPGHEEIVARTTLCLVRLVQLYMDATKQGLQESEDEVDCKQFCSPYEANYLNNMQASKPPVIALWMSRLMALGKQLDMYDEHLVEDCDKHMEQLINAFMTGHKVKGTPVPYPYAQLLNLGIVISVCIIPFSYAPQYQWTTIAICLLIALAFFGMNWAGIEIQDPFGTDANDFELDKFAQAVHDISVRVVHMYMLPGTTPANTEEWLKQPPDAESFFHLSKDLEALVSNRNGSQILYSKTQNMDLSMSNRSLKNHATTSNSHHDPGMWDSLSPNSVILREEDQKPRNSSSRYHPVLDATQSSHRGPAPHYRRSDGRDSDSDDYYAANEAYEMITPSPSTPSNSISKMPYGP